MNNNRPEPSNKREELHYLLVDLFGSEKVYYQPPENLKMEYPCIRYSVSDVAGRSADNMHYHLTKRYEIVVIDKRPDNPVIDKLLELQMATFNRHYVSDGLNHDIIYLYY